jgi:hypothetical protein
MDDGAGLWVHGARVRQREGLGGGQGVMGVGGVVIGGSGEVLALLVLLVLLVCFCCCCWLLLLGVVGCWLVGAGRWEQLGAAGRGGLAEEGGDGQQ